MRSRAFNLAGRLLGKDPIGDLFDLRDGREAGKMPRIVGTGPRGRDPETGSDMGEQRLRRDRESQRSDLAAWRNGYCVCPNCGERAAHQLDSPCYEQACPKCGTVMERKECPLSVWILKNLMLEESGHALPFEKSGRKDPGWDR